MATEESRNETDQGGPERERSAGDHCHEQVLWALIALLQASPISVVEFLEASIPEDSVLAYL